MIAHDPFNLIELILIDDDKAMFVTNYDINELKRHESVYNLKFVCPLPRIETDLFWLHRTSGFCVSCYQTFTLFSTVEIVLNKHLSKHR